MILLPMLAMLWTHSTPLRGAKSIQMSATPFSEILDVSEPDLQAALRLDVERRLTELTLLGWLGRAYLAAPFLFEKAFPSVFRLEPYENSTSTVGKQGVELTLRESSVVQRGIPFCLQLATTGDSESSITDAALLGIGCDLRAAAAAAAATTTPSASADRIPSADALCARIQGDRSTKRLVVRAITAAIFGKLSAARDAIDSQTKLVVCGPSMSFTPRNDLFAREGSTEKWLQLHSGYYFSQSEVVETRFAEGAAPECVFSFYYDPTEPFNSDNPTRNINPEVIYCAFTQTVEL